jgi:hypothetical protein
MNGLQFVERLQEVSRDSRVIIVTGARQESVAVSAMKLGVSDYVSKDEFLTSGIVRSLQAALRERTETYETEQREQLGARNRELQTASIEGSWLVQALDERHGYVPDGSTLRDALPFEWNDIVRACNEYLTASCASFPEPATAAEDALLRVLTGRGLSPRDVFRVYVAALREMMGESGSDGSPPVRPVLFLAHLLACLVEEWQMAASLRDANAMQTANA